MITEFRKSINSILYERVSGPLFGTITVSWITWNWKIIYLTIFVSESKICNNKIEYIVENYSNFNTLIYYPLITTFVFITVVPFISNGAFWINLYFRQWRSNKKLIIEEKKIMSQEKANSLKNELREKENEYEKIIEVKNEEISSLKSIVDNLDIKIADKTVQIKNMQSKKIRNFDASSYTVDDYEQLKNDKKAFDVFENIAKKLRSEEKQFPTNTPEDIKEYYLLNRIVESYDNNRSYRLSYKGENIYRTHFNQAF